MKIALLGYGKMGKEIQKVSESRGHEVTLLFNSLNFQNIANEIGEADVAIDFSVPDAAVTNIKACADSGVPVIVGTTGWNQDEQEVLNYIEEKNGAILYASNFSIGVNIFFEINKRLAELMSKQDNYEVGINEIHHTEKLDAPSGTAITLANGIIEKHSRKETWVGHPINNDSELQVQSERIHGVVGTHEIKYDSEIDSIEIKHAAKSRKGFALGSVLAAEFILGKTGVFSMQDVIKSNS